MRQSFLAAASFALLLALSAAAHADTTGASSTAELKKRGDKAMDALRYDDAIDAYTQAYAQSQDPAVLYNRGRVYQARSDYPQALDDIEQFEREATPDLRARIPRLQPLLAELRARVAIVTIRCEVAGARVLLRDKLVATTPLADPVRTNAGPAVIEITRDGYTPYREETELRGGMPTVIEARLVPLLSVLVVRAPGARDVSVDGARLGKPPVETSVQPGTHQIVAEGDDVLRSATSVVLAAGERKEVTMDLVHKPPLVAHWWFWAGAGLVVAAGVVVTYALVTEKSAPQGDHFTPGHVQAPLVSW